MAHSASNSCSLPGVNLSLFEEPARVEPKRPEYLLTVRQTKSGTDIMVCTVHPAPPAAIAEAAEKGIPLFTGVEIQRMRQCLPEVVPYIMEVKRVFPGSSVESIINDMEPTE